MPAGRLSTNFTPVHTIEAFYNGGAVSCKDNVLVAPCGNQAYILDLEHGRIRHRLGSQEDESEVTCLHLAFTSKDAKVVVVGYRNLLLKQWSVEIGSHLRSWKSYHRTPVLVMDFIVRGSYGGGHAGILATGSADGSVRLWNLDLETCLQSIKGAGNGVISSLLFYPDPPFSSDETKIDSARTVMLGIGTGAGPVLICDGISGSRNACLESHTSPVTCMAVAKSGGTSKVLVTGGRDSTFALWSLADGDPRGAKYALLRLVPVFEPIEGLMVLGEGASGANRWFQTDDLIVVTVGEEGIIKAWNSRTSNLVRRFESLLGSGATQLIALDDDCEASESRRFMVTTDDQKILTYTITAADPACTPEQQFMGTNDTILDVSFLGDEHLLVCSNSPDLRVYERAGSNCVLLAGHSDSILGLDVFSFSTLPASHGGDPSSSGSSDGSHFNCAFATCSKDNTIRLWKSYRKTRKRPLRHSCVAIASGHTKTVAAVRFSKSTNASASAASPFLVSVSEDGTLKLWRLPENLAKVKPPRQINTGSDAPVTPEVLSTRCTLIAHSKDVTSVDISPNNKLIATGSMDKTVKIWSIGSISRSSADVTLAQTIAKHKRGIWDVAFSPVDQVVVSASGDATLKICSLTDGSCVRTFEGHESAVLKVVFLPTGLQLLSADTCGLLKLWTIKTSECVKTLDGHDGKVWGLTLHPSGCYFVSGGADSKALVWKDITDEEAEEAHRKADSEAAEAQRLDNLTQQKHYTKALQLAISLNRPFSALTILKQMLAGTAGDDSSSTGNRDDRGLREMIRNLSDADLATLLRFSVEWNTKSRTCEVAQSLLHCILRTKPPGDLLMLPNCREIVEALLVYSDRHFDRLSRLKQDTAFLDYTWQCMRRNIGYEISDEDVNDGNK